MDGTLNEQLFRHRELLAKFAPRFVWWKSVSEAMEMPQRIVAGVMNNGTYEDVERLAAALGDNCLREVIRRAEPGQFSPQSWHYWHYRLNLAEEGQVPPLPVRRIPHDELSAAS